MPCVTIPPRCNKSATCPRETFMFMEFKEELPCTGLIHGQEHNGNLVFFSLLNLGPRAQRCPPLVGVAQGRGRRWRWRRDNQYQTPTFALPLASASTSLLTLCIGYLFSPVTVCELTTSMPAAAAALANAEIVSTNKSELSVTVATLVQPNLRQRSTHAGAYDWSVTLVRRKLGYLNLSLNLGLVHAYEISAMSHLGRQRGREGTSNLGLRYTGCRRPPSLGSCEARYRPWR
mmetsp:Transcript_48927/g.138172  ORF Transcript_48927/g.138172 Transcript_48927/m.138172 type:complete len:232 (-) Transcript_48927:302-997(-)